ncbi:MAG: hypothetical protein LBV02_04230 [Bacteroidales bacterium]|jgi:very-short-patch-repair endonuclease|nr:hypothetical protein [Bacteroidales bacterium]
MEPIKETTIGRLKADFVELITETFVEIDGQKHKIGENHRTSYTNSESGRKLLQEQQPESIITSVMAIWGEAPTVEETREVRTKS